MLSTSEVAKNTKDSINYREHFAQFLTSSERSAYTIKNYLCDLDGFAFWLKSARNTKLAPELITPTDLREYKHYLDETLQLKPKTINRKLSSLRSFLNWAGIEGYFQDNRLPHVPQPIKEQANAPKWLDRLFQYDLCRIVEKGRKIRDIAIVKLLLNTGLRVSELCALTWKDINISPKKGRLSVNHGKGAKLRQQIRERLPWIELTELLIEIDKLTGFSQALISAADSEIRTLELQRHLYAAIIAQACNIGLERMARLANLSYLQLAWCNNWYLREFTLKAANNQIVNFQYHLPLSQIWGGGTLSSSDGQRFPVSVKNRLAVSLPRYFGYGQGVSFYSWTSDQFSQYGTKPTISTMRDSTYVLDEILDNETELPIMEHTTDTAGYTELVFAMFDLLGLQFSPRIKDLGGQRLYRANRDFEYQHIESLLSGTIKTDKILAQWDDMLRVAGSLKLGWVTASLFLNKLTSFPQQNDLASSFAEYGRMIKTILALVNESMNM